MKNKFTLLLMMLFCCIATQSFAQIKYGVNAGLNLSTLVVKNNDGATTENISAKAGLHIGFTAEYSFTDKFAFESGLLYSSKGTKYRYTDSGITYKETINYNYLEIPMNGVYKIDLGNEKVLLKAGPYLGFAFSGKYIYDDGSTDKVNIGSDRNTDDIKLLDFGLNFGAGIEIKSYTFGLQYGVGLANISTDTSNGNKISNSVFGISLGYKFGGK